MTAERVAQYLPEEDDDAAPVARQGDGRDSRRRVVHARPDSRCGGRHQRQVPDLKNPKFETTIVATSDQINDESLELKSPKYLCTPASLNCADVPNPVSHLTCYGAKGAELSPRPHVEVEGALGQSQLELKQAATLCLPSSKTVLP